MQPEGCRDKTRVLPAWMTAAGPEKRVGSAKTPKRRRTTVPTASATRLPARRTVYCMNEAELVNVALSILMEGRAQESPPEKNTAGPSNGERSPSPLMSLRSPEGTSEDEDSGAEALPPSTTPSQGSQNSDSALTCSQSPAEEDDALKYVREIFFS